ncbi:MAG: hypothetical protein ACOC0Z_00230 [Halohasta sp.]
MSYTVAFALGRGKWAAMGLLLARSLSIHTDCEQFIFLPSEEAGAVPAAIREECADHGRLHEAPPVHPGYPIATKLQAFKRAAEAASTDSVVLLDTDTLVVDRLTHTALGGAELAARPANFAHRRRETGMGEVLDPALFERFGYPFPTEQVDGAVDGEPMPASWNAGVVATTDHELPGEWLSLTLDVYEAMDPSHRRFADQVALAMLATDREVRELPAADNFPAAFRFRFPSSVRVLHYHGFHHLLRVRNDALRRTFERIGVADVKEKYVDEPVFTTGLKHVGTNLSHRIVGW